MYPLPLNFILSPSILFYPLPSSFIQSHPMYPPSSYLSTPNLFIHFHPVYPLPSYLPTAILFPCLRFNTRHVALRIAYIGCDLQGYAVQEDTDRTVEAELFDALQRTRLIESRLVLFTFESSHLFFVCPWQFVRFVMFKIIARIY